MIVGIDGSGNYTVNCLLTQGTGSWSCSSSLAAMENVQTADSRDILERLSQLPVLTWQAGAEGVRHIGPAEEAFHAAFGLGQPRLTIDVDLRAAVPIDQPSSIFIRQVLDHFLARIENALEFAWRSRVILITASNGCPVDISMGLPGHEDEVMRRAVEFELEPGKAVRVCSAEDPDHPQGHRRPATGRARRRGHRLPPARRPGRGHHSPLAAGLCRATGQL